MGYLRVVNSKTGQVYDTRGNKFTREYSLGDTLEHGPTGELVQYGEGGPLDLDQFLNVLYAGDTDKINMEKLKMNVPVDSGPQPLPFDLTKMEEYK